MTKKQRAEIAKHSFTNAAYIMFNIGLDLGLKPKYKLRRLKNIMLEEAQYQYDIIIK